jgi:hypothetical protein
MLAEVISLGGGSGLIHGLLMLLIVAVCLLLVWYFGKWVLGKLGAPDIALTIWTGLFGLVGLIIVLNFLLGLGGHPFITY